MTIQMSTPTARERYRRETDAFIATRTQGGGFIRFGGFYRGWDWVVQNCLCAVCRNAPTYRKSTVRADGLIVNATYFVCNSAERHVIRKQSDLVWRVGAEARDERHRVKGTIKDVRDAYEWLGAAAPADETEEEVPF